MTWRACKAGFRRCRSVRSGWIPGRSRRISWTVFGTVTAPPWTAGLAAIASGLPRRPFRSRPSPAPRCWESAGKWTRPWQREGSGVFDPRATATEFLDRPDCDPTLAAASYRFMETVNCYFGGIRTVRRFLAAETAGRHAGAPLRILDIGSGSCDIPLAVSWWAHAYDIPLHFTCLEIAGHAVDIAHR